MKYIRDFTTKASAEHYLSGDSVDKPYVVLDEEQPKVYLGGWPNPFDKRYLRFVSEGEQSFMLKENRQGMDPYGDTFEYSNDGVAWYPLVIGSSGTVVNCGNGQAGYIRGNNPENFIGAANYGLYIEFTTTAATSCSGELSALADYTDTSKVLKEGWYFGGIFHSWGGVSS